MAAGLTLMAAFAGCAAAGGGERSAPVPIRALPVSSTIEMSPAESAYVRQTARTLYRGAAVERTSGFLFSDTRGHGVCVRSPAGQAEAADYTLLVLQRRVFEDFISQAADDVLILRSRADVVQCRGLGREPGLWVRL